MDEPVDVVTVLDPETRRPALEVLVNFGVALGRQATRAEVERLSEELLARLAEASVVVADRYELSLGASACLHEVRIAVPADVAATSGYEFDVLRELVAGIARTWAESCRELPPEGGLTLAERLAPNVVSLDG